jgi:hypothetical protein
MTTLSRPGPAVNKSLARAIEHLREAVAALNAATGEEDAGLLDAELEAMHALVSAPARNEAELLEKLAVCLAFEREQFGHEPDVDEPFGCVAAALAAFLDRRH